MICPGFASLCFPYVRLVPLYASAFGSVIMLYVDMEVNGHPLKVGLYKLNAIYP